MIIGCAQLETGEFKNQKADGIFGLCMHNNPLTNTPPNTLDIIKKQGYIKQKSFSFCLSEKGGYFVIGKSTLNDNAILIDCVR